MRKELLAATAALGWLLATAAPAPLYAGEGDPTPAAGEAPFALAVHAASTDTPIVFLPPEAASVARERLLRTGEGAAGDPDEGRIGMTVEVAPGPAPVAVLPLRFCLDLPGEGCLDLPVWDGAGAYADELVVEDLATDIPKSAYVELLLPTEVVARLRARGLSEPAPFTVMARIAGTEERVPVDAVDVVDLPEGTAPRTAARTYSKRYEKDFSNDNFGARVDVGSYVKFDNASGAVAARGTGYATVFGHDFEFVMARGDGSLDRGVTADGEITVEFLGAYTLYHVEKHLSATWASSKSFVKEKGYSKTFLVAGFIPVKVAAGASGELGIQWKLYAKSGWSILGGDVGPFVDAGAYAKAAINLAVAEGGIKGRLSLLRDDFWLTTQFDTRNLSVRGEVTNDLSGPGGKVGPYVAWSEPGVAYKKVCVSIPWVGRCCKRVPYPTVVEKEAFYPLVDWRSYRRSDTLLRF